MHQFYGLLRQLGSQLGNLEPHDGQFLLNCRIADKEIEAASLERLRKLARVVRGQKDERAMHGGQSAQFRHADLKVTQYFKQKGFKLSIGAVDLVDQQHGGRLVEDRFEQGALKQKAHGEEDIFLIGQAVCRICQRIGPCQRLLQLIAQQLGVEQLFGILPLIQRLGFVQPFIALKADQLAARRRGYALGQFGLAHACRPFQQQRLAQLVSQKYGCPNFVVGDVLLLAQRIFHLRRGIKRLRHAHRELSHWSSAPYAPGQLTESWRECTSARELCK